MVDYGESIKVAHAMIKWGGSFVHALGFALQSADVLNRQKIKDAFPEEWEEYLRKSDEWISFDQKEEVVKNGG